MAARRADRATFRPPSRALRLGRLPLRTLGLLLTLAAMLLATSVAASAATPPYEPDPTNVVGGLTLYDATGNVITTGNVNDAPFAAYVQGGATVRGGDTKATLYGYLPQNGVAPGAWSGEALSTSQTYPNAAAPGALGTSTLPLVALTNGSTTLATLEGDLPNTASDAYQGLYQLRIKTSAAGLSVTTQWDAADIFISGNTWTQVYPVPTTSATSTALAVTPGSPQNSGVQVTLTATVTPSNAPGSVQFLDGAAPIGGPVAVVGGTASTSTSGLTVGSHSLTAQFTPTNPASNPTEFSGSTSTAQSFLVTTAPATPTNTALGVDVGTGVAFAPVTLTATVTPGSAPGTVTFADGAVVLGTTPAGTGTFTLVTSSLAQGQHTITATFNPTDPANFAQSTITGSAFTLSAPLYTPAVGNVQAEIAAGTLTISTPYTSGNPLDLGNLALNAAATEYSGSATFTGITITDTRAGDLPWTASALASALSNGSGGTINGENVGLTDLVADPIAGNALTAASVVTSNNPAADPAVAPGDAGTAGLGGGTNHTVLAAAHGQGSIAFHGTLTVNAPTSSPPGTYAGTVTFTIG